MLTLKLQDFWKELNFTPNENQEIAITNKSGPLFLTAGPGSGKTRVLLWRTFNLIVCEKIPPSKIFLSTFTEKAAFQLKEGLRNLLNVATNKTGEEYDISELYIGTVHSLCQKLLRDRRFAKDRRRSSVPVLMDEIEQFFYLYNKSNWAKLTSSVGIEPEAAYEIIAEVFQNKYTNRYQSVINIIGLFNRFSEEYFKPALFREKLNDKNSLLKLVDMYEAYCGTLLLEQGTKQTDFSLLQSICYERLLELSSAGSHFEHVIIDEYQDTNSIQEKIFFKLIEDSKNICVVGDDDQALYRFRGATVENFVEFPHRTNSHLGSSIKVKQIPLDINYRSRKGIVDFYCSFINSISWNKDSTGENLYRVPKNIKAFSTDSQLCVFKTSYSKAKDDSDEIAFTVKQLIKQKKVEDPNQIAFLFPSLKSTKVQQIATALENHGINVYAPRMKTFLEVDEAVDLFGIFLQIFGKPERQEIYDKGTYKEFNIWLDSSYRRGRELMNADKALKRFVDDKKQEINNAISDYQILSKTCSKNNWKLEHEYEIDLMKRKLYESPGLSEKARRTISSAYLDKNIRDRKDNNDPLSLSYVINSATSIDWSVLDLFHRLGIFTHFKKMYDLAEKGIDEGPVCNLGLISRYLAKFMEEFAQVLTASFLNDNKFQIVFFMSYLYTLYKRGESEYEDADDPFPKGRVPFLTVHQSKGLEFPVVVLGSPTKRNNVQKIEEIVRPLLGKDSEPLERMSEFDNMRMFYVALSRAKNLLLINCSKGTQLNDAFKAVLPSVPSISELDISTIPQAKVETNDLSKNYSYTSDYLWFNKCPRQYMLFRKYRIIPSRSQTMFFGNLVHQTIEDLHHELIRRREEVEQK